MSDTESEVVHELLKPFKYTPKNSGEEVEAQFIALREPSVQQLTACTVLKQAFMRVIAGQAGEAGDEISIDDDKEADKVPMEDRIMNALYASDTDMTKLLLSAKELFKEVGLVDGEKKLTVPMLSVLCIEDLEKMTGKYMANFILVSVLQEA